MVGSQYALYVWRKRALKSYQKATLAGVILGPAAFGVQFKCVPLPLPLSLPPYFGSGENSVG